jgi:RNA-splicing ligase RtcB
MSDDRATAGLAVDRGLCRSSPFGTLGTDETPEACKPIDAVMAAPADLVEVVDELRQIVCLKG